MNPFGVPALVACVLLWTLELLGWVFRARERVNLAFAFFCGWMGADAFVNFLLLQHHDAPYVDKILPFALITGTGAVLSALLFVVVLTGHDRRLDERLFGIRLRMLLPVVVAAVLITITLIALKPPYVLNGFDVTETGIQVHFGTFAWLLIVVSLPLPLTIWGMLLGALRGTTDPIEKRFLRTNTIGLAILILSQPLFEVVLVLFDIPSPYLSYVGGAIGAVFFFVAMVRHPLDHVEELNRTLELKVAERTRNLREAQARLVQSEKIASLAHLVAGVAHEFNTPLGAVKSSAASVQKGLTSLAELTASGEPLTDDQRARAARLTDGTHRAMGVVRDGVDRIASGVRRLASFAHLDEPTIHRTDLNRGVEDAIALLPYGWQQRIRLVRDYGNLPEVTCIPVLVNQVFFNALNNAIESIDGEGEIRLETFVENGHAVFRLRDNGSGIAGEHLDRIFDPGFTTKGPGVGMGLGLAIAHNVMEQHHGDIEIESAPGVGTVLTLRFPLDLTAERIHRGPFSALSQEPGFHETQE